MTLAPIMATDLSITRLSAALGAEVEGVDLRRAAASAGDAEAIAAVINELLIDHKVLFFPGQHLTPDQQVALGRPFGPLEGHPHFSGGPGLPQEIFQLVASAGGIADEWHTDLTFMDEPSVMSILNMVRCPRVGGDTCWSNLEAAFDALSAPMQELCRGLTALHDAHPHNRSDKMAVHPVVRTHPVTGRHGLYVNEHFTRRIVELSATESDNLLSYLTNLVKEPRFVVRYRWAEGTIGIWDNRCTQHHVVNDFELGDDEDRIIQRVTVMGDRPAGDEPRWAPHLPDRPSAVGRLDRQLAQFLKGR